MTKRMTRQGHYGHPFHPNRKVQLGRNHATSVVEWREWRPLPHRTNRPCSAQLYQGPCEHVGGQWVHRIGRIRCRGRGQKASRHHPRPQRPPARCRLASPRHRDGPFLATSRSRHLARPRHRSARGVRRAPILATCPTRCWSHRRGRCSGFAASARMGVPNAGPLNRHGQRRVDERLVHSRRRACPLQAIVHSGRPRRCRRHGRVAAGGTPRGDRRRRLNDLVGLLDFSGM
jgi:hypothetical protein